MFWQTSRRQITLDRPLVMAILNVTPDSFSDGGEFADLDVAVRQAEKYAADGADIIDIGGESTRPGSKPVPADEEVRRVIPVIDTVAKRFDIPISIDTTKSSVAKRAVEAGAEIINDISGLRFDARIAEVSSATGCGLVLMHSRGSFEAMHSQQPVDDIMTEVLGGLNKSVSLALEAGVAKSQIALDIGIGFGKSFEQNLELLANLDKIRSKFAQYPFVVGTSRKSFLGKILRGIPPGERLIGNIATAVIAAAEGANIIRVHDAKETIQALKAFASIENEKRRE
jgi:dihydropteroate synthase